MGETNNFDVSTKLKIERVKKNLTQQDVANYLGIKQQTYSKYEKGSPISDDIIIKLCKLYDISADELLGIRRNKTVNQSFQIDEAKINQMIKNLLEKERKESDD